MAENKEKLLVPNSTQIPNIILDLIVPALPEAEARVLLYIARRTYGFRKASDLIGLGQFESGIKSKGTGEVFDKGTGLKRTAIKMAIQNLEEALFIKVTRGMTKGGGKKINRYAINTGADIDEGIAKIESLRELENKRLKNKPKQRLLFGDETRSSTRPRSYARPTTRSGNDTSLGRVPDHTKESQNKENKDIASTSSPHKNLIKFFWETSKKTRGVSPLFNPRDGANLKRVLEHNLLSEADFEKLIVYYLASPEFTGFSPDISIFLSKGVLNILMNKLARDANFYKNLDSYYQTIRIATPQAPDVNEMQIRIARMKNSLVEKLTV